MNILYILGAYKPRASANGICSDNIIKQLANEGHSVTVLANASIGCKSHCTDGCGIEVFRVKQRLFLRMKEWREVKQPEHPLMGKIVAKGSLIVNKLQLLVTAPFWPKISPLTIHRFRKTALKLQSENQYDVVISVYTPIEALLAGYAIKKKYAAVLFVPYFLDSLSGGYGPKCFCKQKTMRRGLAIEKEIFAVADKIVLMKSSEAHQRKHNKQYSEKFCFLDIPMFKKTDIAASKRNENSKEIRMLFVGSIAASVRSPDTLISALLLLQTANVACEFIGNIDCMERFKLLKEKYGRRLVFTGFMNHDKLTDKIESADILLNIGNLVATMVPSKIFEYMSYGKPIISTFDIEDEPSKKYLQQYPLALLLSGKDDPKKNADSIAAFINKSLGKSIAYDEIKKQFYLNTPAAFMECIIDNK